jgi:hypothetical protein
MPLAWAVSRSAAWTALDECADEQQGARDNGTNNNDTASKKRS